MKYRFIRTVMVDGVKYEVGKVVSDGDLPAGCLDSCRFVGHVIEHHAPPAQSPAKAPAKK